MNNNFYQRNNNQQGAPAHQQTQREKLRISVEPMEFDGVWKTKIMTTVDLAKIVNGIFRPVFNDFEGSLILLDQFNRLNLTLYFSDKGQAGEDQYKVLTPANRVGRNSTAAQRILSFKTKNRNKNFNLTNEAKELLIDFMPTKPGKQFNWDTAVFEQQQQTGYNSYNIVVGITGLNLTKIIRMLYRNNSNKGNYDYEITILRPVGTDYGFKQKNYLINIMQFNNAKVQELAEKNGLIAPVGQISMVR